MACCLMRHARRILACLLLTQFRRTEGCRVEGSVCYKDSPDCQWSVALGKEGVGDRQVWALKVGGRCGRMAIGLALDVDEVRGAGTDTAVSAWPRTVLAVVHAQVLMHVPGSSRNAGGQGARWVDGA